MKPIISGILPCYNVEKYIERCIQSIINQTFKDWEAIFVDDGSTDNTGAIIDRYVALDKRLKVVHTKNQGVSSARNEGIAIAKGNYLHFIDPDDWLETNCFEICYKELSKNNADCVHFDKYIHHFKKPGKLLHDKELDYKVVTGDDIYKEYTLSLIGIGQEVLNKYYEGESVWKYKHAWQGWSFMFSRDVIIKNGIIFRPQLKTQEDGLFVVEYSMFSKKIVRLPNRLYHYDFRDNGALFSRTNNSNKIFTDKYALLDERERLRTIFYNREGVDIQNYYLGSHVFSCLELLLKIDDSKDGYTLCKRYIYNKYVQESINKVSIKKAPLKFKGPVYLLKHNVSLILILCYFMNKILHLIK